MVTSADKEAYEEEAYEEASVVEDSAHDQGPPGDRNIRKQYGRQVDANDKVLEDKGVADLHPDDVQLLKSVLKYRLEGETTVRLLLALCRKSSGDPKALLQPMINQHEADEDYAFSPPTAPVSLPSSTPVPPLAAAVATTPASSIPSTVVAPNPPSKGTDPREFRRLSRLTKMLS
ncbi:hypothetical protein H257_05755 [Aphanomyces astaci]|uniref:Uncharacterized protein n=1 Tax=Aphanomyces astaci TaxID=112090 RepID=W4GQL4_APHAT|nr:hypothetical protein H257_05755 [Aphanomyces astaci]ETV81168.1 hypothetical protein H257_05755 [Aphanomyces astaci]|eukprot:XP_009829026.1 hypothetical protein H257_05755 [Aphanomyces astaci]